jgi:putative FmdB family regulatory protein
MPLFEFRCRKCQAVTEVLFRSVGSENHAVTCAQCGSGATAKVVSRVSFKVAKPAKYSEDFLHKAQPFLRAQKQTAEFFAEGKKGSDDAKTFQLAEQIGDRIDRTLATRLPTRKR